MLILQTIFCGKRIENLKKAKFEISIVIFLTILILFIIGSEVYLYKNSGGIVISEVCASNRTIVYDDIGNFSDYIELYNTASYSINLKDYALSDSKKNYRKYIFPDIILPSNEYLIIWATGKESIWYPYFAGFSLSAKETVYLSNRKGKVISSVTIPDEVQPDLSYARSTNNEYTWQSASPGSENINSIILDEEHFSEDILTFSADAGFYEEPFNLEIRSANGFQIYYTKDGSIPNKNSSRYEGPIYIENPTYKNNVYAAISNISVKEAYLPDYNIPKVEIVRAVSIDKDGNRSKEIRSTYLVGYDDIYGFKEMPIVSIITNPENLFSDEHGIYVSGKIWADNKREFEGDAIYNAPANYAKSGMGWEREASIEYFGKLGQYNKQNIGIRIHGGWSIIYNQKSFNLYAKNQEALLPSAFPYKEYSMLLRAGGFRDLYSTKLRDVINQVLVKDRSITIQEAVPCQVFLNGEYWGMYNLQERICESVVADKYQCNHDDIIVRKVGNIESGFDEEIELYNDIVKFVTTSDMSIYKNYEKICDMIDIQSYIDYYAFEIYVANCDSISNNYAMWRTRNVKSSPYYDGKWRWILYDTDDSTGMVPGMTDANTDSFSAGHWSISPTEDQFFQALIKNKNFKERFVNSFMDMANYNFNIMRVKQIVEIYSKMYCDSIVLSHRRFIRQDYQEDDFQNEIQTIVQFYEQRYNYITQYMQKNLGLHHKNSIVIKSNIVGEKIMLNTLILEMESDFSGEYFSDYPIKLAVDPIDGHKFIGWKIDGKLFSKDKSIILDMQHSHVIETMWED